MSIKYDVGDVIKITLDCIDMGREGTVIEVIDDEIKVTPNDGKPWGIVPGSSSTDFFWFTDESVSIVKYNFKKGDKVTLLSVGRNGKKYETSTIKANSTGIVERTGDREGRLSVTFDRVTTVINENFLTRYTDPSNRVLPLKGGEFIAVKGVKGLCQVMEVLSKSFIYYQNIATGETSETNRKNVVSKVSLSSVMKKYISKDVPSPIKNEDRTKYRELRGVLSDLNRQRRTLMQSNIDTSSLNDSIRAVKYELKTLTGKEQSSRFLTLKCLNTGTTSKVNKRSTLEMRKAYINFKRLSTKGSKPFKKSFMGNYTIDYDSPNKFRVHQAGGQFKTINDHLNVNRIKLNKVPRKESKDNHIGIELECFSTWGRGELEAALTEAKLSKNCQVTGDGSIRPDRSGYDGIEVKVFARQEEYSDVLARVLEVLAKGDARVNSSCGLHVHYDMRNRNPALVHNNLLVSQSMLFRACSPERSGNSYCVPLTFHRYDPRREGGHYDAISTGSAYRKYKTFEIRIHEGSLDHAKISNWIDTILAIVEHDTMLSNGMSDDDILKNINLSSVVAAKFKARIAA